MPFVLAGAGTGVLNALLGREAIASVPPDRAAMGSGANNTARYLGAACGITLFVTVATHTGDDLYAGWNAAALVARWRSPCSGGRRCRIGVLTGDRLTRCTSYCRSQAAVVRPARCGAPVFGLLSENA